LKIVLVLFFIEQALYRYAFSLAACPRHFGIAHLYI